MDFLTAAVTLHSGATVTVCAWSYLNFSASLADYRNLLAAFRERIGAGTGELPQQLLLDRVIMAAVPAEADRGLIMAADLPLLLDAIFVLNRVEDITAKSLGLHMRLLQAEASALETPLNSTS